MPQKQRTPAYCHHKATGRAFVRIDGRMMYLGKYGSQESLTEYDRLIGEWLGHGRTLPAVSGLTVTEVAAAYWLHVTGYYVKNGKPTREVDCIRQALKPVRRLYGETAADAFGPSAIRAWPGSTRARDRRQATDRS